MEADICSTFSWPYLFNLHFRAIRSFQLQVSTDEQNFRLFLSSVRLAVPPSFLLSTKCGSLPLVFYPRLSPTVHWTVSFSFVLKEPRSWVTHPTTTLIFTSMPNTLSHPLTEPSQITTKLCASCNRNKSPTFIKIQAKHIYHILLSHTQLPLGCEWPFYSCSSAFKPTYAISFESMF